MVSYRQLEDDEKVDDWFPGILNNYETFVKYSYSVEKSTTNETEYLKEYLREDLQVTHFYLLQEFITVV